MLVRDAFPPESGCAGFAKAINRWGGGPPSQHSPSFLPRAAPTSPLAGFRRPAGLASPRLPTLLAARSSHLPGCLPARPLAAPSDRVSGAGGDASRSRSSLLLILRRRRRRRPRPTLLFSLQDLGTSFVCVASSVRVAWDLI